MLKRGSAFLLGVIGLMAFLGLQAPAPANAQGVEVGNVLIVTSEVVGIDRVDRTLTLLGPGGDVVSVEVGHGARNFGQIQIGDKLKVKYYQSVAIHIGKRGQKPGVSAGMVAARAEKGAMPGGLVAEVVDVTATIKAIDRQNRTVTFKLPDGKMITTRVDKSVKGLDNLKEGDSVHARYTESIAISVEKP